jgi:hypothetical protein
MQSGSVCSHAAKVFTGFKWTDCMFNPSVNFTGNETITGTQSKADRSL